MLPEQAIEISKVRFDHAKECLRDAKLLLAGESYAWALCDGSDSEPPTRHRQFPESAPSDPLPPKACLTVFSCTVPPLRQRRNFPHKLHKEPIWKILLLLTGDNHLCNFR